MTRNSLPIAFACAATLAGCATTGASDSASEPPATQACNADAVQSYVGKAATQQNGTEIVAKSGASRFRWGAPDSVWTMDYRVDRVNVRYDAKMVITEITCG